MQSGLSAGGLLKPEQHVPRPLTPACLHGWALHACPLR